MRILTGDECGLLKETIPELCRQPPPSHAYDEKQSKNHLLLAASRDESLAVTRIGDGEQGRAGGAVGLAKLPFVPRRRRARTLRTGDDEDEDEGEDEEDEDGSGAFGFASLRIDGTVETWSASRPGYDEDGYTSSSAVAGGYRLVDSVSDVFGYEEEGKNENGSKNGATDVEAAAAETAVVKGWETRQKIRPIGMASSLSAKGDNPLLTCCDSAGRVSVLRADALGKGVVARYDAFGGGKRKKNLDSITYTKGMYNNNQVATAMAVDGSGRRVAVGGRERETTILDVETGKQIWKAKNLPPDPQTLLQQPIWSTALQFLQQSTAADVTGSDNLLAAGTAYKQLRIYDIRCDAGGSDSSFIPRRRPVLKTPEGTLPNRITALCELRDGYSIAVGDAAGFISALDLRRFGDKRSSNEFGRFVGPGGSIRGMEMHPTLPVLACVGLDRTLWTFDAKTRKKLDCVYLRQRVNCMMFCDDGAWDPYAVEEVDESGLPGNTWEDVDGDIEEEDRVADYVDSDEDADGEDSDDDEEAVENNDDDMSEDSDGKTGEDSDDDDDGGEKDSSDETASSDEGSGDDDNNSPTPPKRNAAKKGSNQKKRRTN